jgi:hypothetical protein
LYKRLILMGSLFLTAAIPAAAQTQFLHAALKPRRSLEPSSIFHPVLFRMPAYTPLRIGRVTIASPRGGAILPSYSSESEHPLLPQPDHVDTLFISRSSMPVASFAGGHLLIQGFGSTIHMTDVEFGPSGAGGLLDFRAPRQYQPSTPHSIDTYGLSLSLHFGHGADISQPIQIWKSLLKILREQR